MRTVSWVDGPSGGAGAPSRTVSFAHLDSTTEPAHVQPGPCRPSYAAITLGTVLTSAGSRKQARNSQGTSQNSTWRGEMVRFQSRQPVVGRAIQPRQSWLPDWVASPTGLPRPCGPGPTGSGRLAASFLCALSERAGSRIRRPQSIRRAHRDVSGLWLAFCRRGGDSSSWSTPRLTRSEFNSRPVSVPGAGRACRRGLSGVAEALRRGAGGTRDSALRLLASHEGDRTAIRHTHHKRCRLTTAVVLRYSQ